MNPQPVEDEIKRRYREGSGEDYLSYELANEKAFLNLELLALKDAGFYEIEKETVGNLYSKAEPKEAGAKPLILDLGCAIGSLLALLRERGWETMGVEIGGPQADYCREKRNLDVRSLPLEENHFPPSSFNVVLASHLIEHLNNPATMVAEVHRILVPKGLFFVTTPNIAGFQAKLFGNRWRSAIFDHLYLFSVKTLSWLLEENGFLIEKISTWGGLAAGTAPESVKRLLDKAVKRLGLGDVMILRARRI
jgi:2-polyprenyl-3-methyl-5-hydroxy-6-metoxy-1,4-benzoquinol methylase